MSRRWVAGSAVVMVLVGAAIPVEAQSTDNRRPDMEAVKYEAANAGRFNAENATPESLADDVLVGNVDQNPAQTHQRPLTDVAHQYWQSFATGDLDTTLSSVTLPDLGSVAAGTAASVSIHSYDDGVAGTLLHTLTAPETLSTGADATFTTPVDTTIVLSANTRYFLGVAHVAGSASLSLTLANGEDPESDPGWSVGNFCRYEDSATESLSMCHFGKSLRVLISGSSSVTVPLLSIGDAFATEGSAVGFSISMSKSAETEVTVSYSTSDGTATADPNATDGADYTAAASETVTIAAGETTKTISIPTGDDAVDEGDETFTVTLSDASGNAALGASISATGTIVDNDETAQTDATLSALVLNDVNGTAIGLTPSFDRYVGLYTATVANDINSLTATATKNESAATLVFVGADSTGSGGEATYELDVGNNLVKVMVTAQDGNRVKIYMVNVTRAPSDDATLSGLTVSDSQGTGISLTPATFDPDTGNYTTLVSNTVDSALVEVTKSHSAASVLIITIDETTVADSATVNLDPGDNLIKIMVTAEDGETAKVYQVIVTRDAPGIRSDATLRAFEIADSDGVEVLLWSSFHPDVGFYDASVGNSVTSITATATPSRYTATMVSSTATALARRARSRVTWRWVRTV